MRRIIERTVTVVTTTTWKISCQEDAALSTEKADQAVDEFPKPHVSQVKVQSTEQVPPVSEAKEVNLWVRKSNDEKTAEEPTKNSYFID